MRDDPREIAKNLIQEHGLNHARRIAVKGTSTAKEEGDNYGLSVWREIKRDLNERTSEK
jgi:hypothetical protein